jgi:hypothetical protein
MPFGVPRERDVFAGRFGRSVLGRPTSSLRVGCRSAHVVGVRRGVASGGLVEGPDDATEFGRARENIGGCGGSWCVSRGA